MSQKPVEHIRREDECEITFCGQLTEMCLDPQDTTPIRVDDHAMAVYADQPHLPGYVQCPDCGDAYFEWTLG